MVFNSIEDLKKYLLLEIDEAVMAAGELVYEKADEKLAEFYVEYEPDYYKRTNQLRDNSLRFMPLTPIPNGAKVGIGYTDDDIGYKHGNTSLTVWNAMMGDYPHGGWKPAGGEPVFGKLLTDLYELGYADYALERGMDYAGIPFKKNR